jgi:hypothetical protein
MARGRDFGRGPVLRTETTGYSTVDMDKRGVRIDMPMHIPVLQISNHGLCGQGLWNLSHRALATIVETCGLPSLLDRSSRGPRVGGHDD